MKNIRDLLKKVYTAAGNSYSDAKADPSYKKCLIFSIILSLILFVFFFPVNTLIMRAVKSQEGIAFRSASISGLEASLFGRTGFESCDIVMKSREEISISGFSSDLSLISILTGNISGQTNANEFSYSSSKFTLKSALNIISDLDVDGKSGAVNGGSLVFKMSSVSIDGISIAGFKIPPADISSVSGEITFSKDSIESKAVKIEGKSLRGVIKAKINPDWKKFQLSRLDIECSFDPESPLFNDYKMMISYLLDKESNMIKLRLRGTVGSPEFITSQPESASGMGR